MCHVKIKKKKRYCVKTDMQFLEGVSHLKRSLKGGFIWIFSFKGVFLFTKLPPNSRASILVRQDGQNSE